MAAKRPEELIARHLGRDGILDSELALLSVQTVEKQAVVIDRLRVIDWYLDLPAPTVAEVDSAAAKIGVSRRQFYRLLAKLRLHGPVRGLLPGFQNVVRMSSVREGLAEPIESVVMRALTAEPEARISRIQGLVTARCAELGLVPPTEWMLRQRVHALRASGLVGSSAVFGARVVVDQISIDLPIQWAGKVVFGTLTAIIDRSTRLILGASIKPEADGIGVGLGEALSDFRRHRLLGFKEQAFPVAERLHQITWVVAPGLENLVDHAETNPGLSSAKVEADIIDAGPRRHGEHIVRLIGDRLGVYSFRTRNPLGKVAERAQGPGEDIESAERMIGFCADAWNRKLIAQLPATDQSPAGKRDRRLNRLAGDLDGFFQPVFDAVEDRFPNSRML